MKRITPEASSEDLNEIKEGDFVTDGFSKTGIVQQVDIADDGLYKIYEFTLNTDRVITVKR